MGLTTTGRNNICSLMVGINGTAWNSTNAHVGVGDGNTAFTTSDTDLKGTNKLRKKVDGGYPKLSTNVLEFQATFGSADANWKWQEWGVFTANTGGIMLNRAVQDNGTKISGQTWTINVKITINI